MGERTGVWISLMGLLPSPQFQHCQCTCQEAMPGCNSLWSVHLLGQPGWLLHTVQSGPNNNSFEGTNLIPIPLLFPKHTHTYQTPALSILQTKPVFNLLFLRSQGLGERFHTAKWKISQKPFGILLAFNMLKWRLIATGFCCREWASQVSHSSLMNLCSRILLKTCN